MNKKKLVALLLIVIAGVGWFFYEKYHAQQNDSHVIYGNVDIREVKPAFRQSGRIELITHVLAVKYYIACIQTVFLAGDIWPLFLPNIAAMLFIGLLFFVIANKKTSKTLEG